MWTNEEKKKYLRKYKKAVGAVRRAEAELEEMREMKYNITVNNDGMPRGSDQKDLSDFMARLDEVERELQKKKSERMVLYVKISNQISLLNDVGEQNVLFYRYIKGMEWFEVAENMRYSERHIYRLHGKALNHFELPKDVSECQL